MATASPNTALQDEIYALTDKGEQELRGAETSLSPGEIELLVRTDGIATVAQVSAAVRSVRGDAVLEAYRRLARGGYIEPAPSRRVDALDIADFFTTARLRLSSSAVAKAKSAAAASVARLQKQGYDVRIARRPAILAKLPEDRKPRVVVVEDEPHLAKFVRQYLAFEGFDAGVATNRDEIVAEFRRPPVPDLVLLDVMLPDVDGFDVLLKMRQHPVLKAVPVIMLTAKATREAVLKGLAGGADGYVTKPVESETLIKAVRAVLGLPKAPAEQTRAGAPWPSRAR